APCKSVVHVPALGRQEGFPMRGRTVIVNAFDDRNEAQLAVDELERAGFDKDHIGFALRGADVYQGGMITDAQGTKDASGAIRGVATGSLVGGVLGAAAALVVPGIGPVLAGGVLAAAFGGAAAGAAFGGIFGAMSGLGFSEEEAEYMQQRFNEGKA